MKGVSVAIVRVVIIVVLLCLLFSPVEYAFVAFPLSGLAPLYLVYYFCQLFLTIKAHFSLHFHHSATIFYYKSNPPTHLPRVERVQKSPPNGRAPGKSAPKTLHLQINGLLFAVTAHAVSD